MELPEKTVYKILTNCKELAEHMDIDLIYTSRVPEEQSLYKKAPIIRITFIDSSYARADNETYLTSSKLAIDYWTKNLKQTEVIDPIIQNVLESQDYYVYHHERSLDPDSSQTKENQLYMNTLLIKKQFI